MSSMGGEELVVRAAIRDELTAPLREIRDELRETARAADTAGRKANLGARGFDKLAGGAARFVKAGVGAAAKAAVVGLTAVVTAAAVGSAKMLGLASDAAETASAFRTVFKGVAGDVSGYVDRLNKRFGITTAELQRAATTFGVFGKAAGVSRKDLGGFTKDLVAAGLDLSSFYNADPTEVFQALRSGLAGEAEPLRQFGIFLSEAAMKSKAATMGLTGELTESQKVMVRQAIIMESLGDAQGDLARTQDGLANKTKALKGRLTEAATVIGTALLPYAEQLANKLDAKLGPAVERLPATLDRLIPVAENAATALASGEWLSAVGMIDRATGANGKLTGAATSAKDVLDDVATIISDVLIPSLDDAAGATAGLSSPLGILRAALGWAADNTDLVRKATTALIVVLTLSKVASLAAATATRVKATADRIALINLKAHTVGTKTHLVVSKAARAASLTWAAAQWVLNAALTANPIGLVVAGIALLVAGVILAYKKSETFREAVASLWEWLKKFAGFTPLGALIIHFDKVKEAVGDALDVVRELWDKLADSKVGKAIGSLVGAFGDTATSRARGGGNLGATLATHASVSAATGARPTITNALVGGGGRGHGSGDHQAGRALDLQGKGLARYGRYMRALGGYAAFHGSGSTRHLHAVPPAMGDTVHSRARARVTTPTGGRAPVVIEAGAIVVTVDRPAANVDVAEAVREGIEAYLRDREERM